MLSSPSDARAVVVLTRAGSDNQTQYEDEFIELVVSAGVKIVGTVRCQSRYPNPVYFIGKGKSLEVAELVQREQVPLVVVDFDLSPRQMSKLNERTKARVLDRTSLILDIFAQRARSREGKLQVELAQLKYLSTRLKHSWTHLERQKGGIGLRGPGEKQLETDRRLIRQRMNVLIEQIEKVKYQRQQRRTRRAKNDMLSISLVGYTNAGKSTLFNALTGEAVLSSNRLFATLDPTVRKLKVGQLNLLLSDTVGFMRKLPHELVDAFHATLLEVCKSDLILHIEDVSAPDSFERRSDVNNILSSIGADEAPCITVANKIDCVGLTPKIERTTDGEIVSVYVSATDHLGLELLKQAIVEKIGGKQEVYQVCVPAETADLRSFLYKNGVVFEDRYECGKGWFMRFKMSDSVSLRRFYKRLQANGLELSYSV